MWDRHLDHTEVSNNELLHINQREDQMLGRSTFFKIAEAITSYDQVDLSAIDQLANSNIN